MPPYLILLFSSFLYVTYRSERFMGLGCGERGVIHLASTLQPDTTRPASTTLAVPPCCISHTSR